MTILADKHTNTSIFTVGLIYQYITYISQYNIYWLVSNILDEYWHHDTMSTLYVLLVSLPLWLRIAWFARVEKDSIDLVAPMFWNHLFSSIRSTGNFPFGKNDIMPGVLLVYKLQKTNPKSKISNPIEKPKTRKARGTITDTNGSEHETGGANRNGVFAMSTTYNGEAVTLDIGKPFLNTAQRNGGIVRVFCLSLVSADLCRGSRCSLSCLWP